MRASREERGARPSEGTAENGLIQEEKDVCHATGQRRGV